MGRLIPHPARLVSVPVRSRRKFGSRSKRQKPRTPGVAAWGVGIVAGVGVLVGLAHLHGNPPDANGGFPEPALATLAQPAVAAVAALGALVLIAWCIRRVRLEFLAWWPGPIVVQDFVPHREMADADLERLTVGFRDRLAASHLQSPASVPAPAEQGDFLDVLARGGVDSRNLLGSLLSLLRAAVPAHAYEVKGAFVIREKTPSYGMTVHVIRLPGKGGGGQTVWDTSWEGAMRQAADYATASILPRTRVCRSPWAGWRRYYLPAGLMRAYEQAAELEQKRRYDEALDLYYQAVREDPMNHGLRLQIGFLQEKLALYLDALDTYEAILEVAEPNARRGRRPRRDELRRAYRGRARHDRDRTLLVTRYRRAVLLGGNRLAHQWLNQGDSDAQTERDKQRERLRERLAPVLEELFKTAIESRSVRKFVRDAYKEAGAQIPDGDVGAALTKPDKADDLMQLLPLASLHELEDLRHRIPLVSFRRRSTLSRAAVRVSSLVVRERLRWVLTRTRHSVERETPPCLEGGWDAYVEQIRRELKRIEGRAGFDRWHEHYNAACIYALPLLEGCTKDDDGADKLAGLAVSRLERATARADSAFIASRRDWLISEDPDLQGLRAHPRFKRFEVAYFPSASRTPQRPREVHRWEVSRYTLDLLRETAGRWEATWEERAHTVPSGAEVQLLLRWCEDERRAWQLTRRVAEHHRHWQTRLQLLKRMRSWSAEYGFRPVEVSFPRFSGDDEADLDDQDTEEATSEAIHDKDLRLDDFVRVLAHAENPGNRGACELIDDLDEWRVALTQLDVGGRQLKRGQVAAVCGAHADSWRRLRQLLTPARDRDEATKEFTSALVSTAVAWRRLPGRWRAGDVIHRPGKIRTNGAVRTPRSPLSSG